MHRRYSNDPRWIIARRPGTDLNGRSFRKGERVYYYPGSRQILAGEAGEQAAAEFSAAAADEDFYTRGRG